MGTRHLIAVYDRNDELRVAQYGQWDGYPSGQGVNILERLPNLRPEQFENLTWAEEVEGPAGSRDTSAEVLDLIQKNPNLALVNALDFAADSLFCEWAYVIDFANNVFEVYKGFNTEPATGRFKDLVSDYDEYKPVTLIASYPLDQLPTEEEFLKLEEE